jgi:uncharacterized protein (DUF1015 family)
LADIAPFRAYRYDGQSVRPEAVLTQPYDKISPKMQDGYYAASPYNLVRIILGKTEPSDTDSSNVYTRAAANFGQWRQEGVLKQDAEPSIYAYSQTFTAPGRADEHVRRGFIAAGRIEDYAKQVVFRHEYTLAKPKADRLNLLRATRAHFGQIFVVYSDPSQQVETALPWDSQPTTELRDEYGVMHRLWKVSDPNLIERVRNAMADKKLIIADGHHRYETALNYRNERRTSDPSAGPDAPFERVMMTFVNMDAPGLLILPTHRVVSGLPGFEVGEFVRQARQFFFFRDITSEFEPHKVQELLTRDDGYDLRMIAVTARQQFLLSAKHEWAEGFLPEFSERQRQLDVVQLHKLLLERVLGMSEEDIREQKHLKYIRDSAEAIDMVQKGADIAFIMNPVRQEQVRDIAFGGEVLPQKSTDYYPKMLSGLTVYSLA